MVAAEALAFLDQEDRHLGRARAMASAARQPDKPPPAIRSPSRLPLTMPTRYNSRLGASYGLCEACFASAILDRPLGGVSFQELVLPKSPGGGTGRYG
jgi:hypothetical protein